MRRGTTPTVTLTVSSDDGSDIDLTGQEVYVTFKESGSKGAFFTKRETDPGVDIIHEEPNTIITVTLTQAETLSFKQNKTVRVQARCKTGDKAIATEIGTFETEEILLDGEI